MKKLSPGNKIVLSVIMIILAAGCGLKSNPVPYVSATGQAQEEQKLSVSVEENAVVLTWLSPGGDYGHMNIEKSELGTTGNVCRDCPRTYTKIADMPAENKSRFVDRAVQKGKSYSYRLSICDEIGSCRQSQTVEINLN